MNEEREGEILGEAFMEPPPSRSPKQTKAVAWQPFLGPIGTQILLDRTSKFKLLYGERGSLKTGICLHDLVLHSYQDLLAPQRGKPWITPLAIICTITRSSATEGGAWEKLNSQVLPEWRDGIDLDFTDPKMDDQKNRYIFIANSFGGWSKVVLKSIPHGENIRGRIKGIEASYFFFDEIVEANSPDYFVVPAQQLRRPTGAPRQFVAACNPSDQGEESWVWKAFVQRPAKESGQQVTIPEGGGRLQGLPPEYGVYHVPLSENVHWSEAQKEEYRKTLMIESVNDESAIDRLIHGLWVARPTGQGLFKGFFNETLHVRGSAQRGIGLVPLAGFPLILGYDLGQVWHSITFMQMIPTKSGRTVWLVFDEVDRLNERVLFKVLAREVKERIRFWRKKCNHPFQVLHIADESAVNQWRPDSGSYDAWEFEKEFNRDLEPGELRARIMGCPKGPGSVEARVRMLQSMLATEEVFISDTCPIAKKMLLGLDSEKDSPGRPRRGPWIHKFDSVTYPPFRFSMGLSRKYLQTQGTAPSLFGCGVTPNKG